MPVEEQINHFNSFNALSKPVMTVEANKSAQTNIRSTTGFIIPGR